MTDSKKSWAIIIPARYASKRFPGKPLSIINGKSLIEHTILAGVAAKQELDGCLGVFVATDDDRIKDHVETLTNPTSQGHVKVIMTSTSCENGTERSAETLNHLNESGIFPDILINLQGDSLLTPARFITALVKEMQSDPNVHVSTPTLRCDPITLKNFLEDARAGRVGGTTMTFSKNRNALYFSKQIIPYLDPSIELGREFKDQNDIPVFHHVGLYGYTPQGLRTYKDLNIGPCETYEKLEQLRFLENDIPIRVVHVESKGEVFWEVNNPEDIDRVSPFLKK